MTIDESELVIADNFVPRSVCQADSSGDFERLMGSESERAADNGFPAAGTLEFFADLGVGSPGLETDRAIVGCHLRSQTKSLRAVASHPLQARRVI